MPPAIALTESMTADAAEPADDSLRAAMIAAPRFWTVEMNSPRSQASSPMTSGAGREPMRALVASGYWVAEWLPQIAMFVTWETGTPARRASWALARSSSSLCIANQLSVGTSGALALAIRQLVLQGLPTTRMRTSEAALAAIALPCGPKIPPLAVSRSPRSMPSLRGIAP